MKWNVIKFCTWGFSSSPVEVRNGKCINLRRILIWKLCNNFIHIIINFSNREIENSSHSASLPLPPLRSSSTINICILHRDLNEIRIYIMQERDETREVCTEWKSISEIQWDFPSSFTSKYKYLSDSVERNEKFKLCSREKGKEGAPYWTERRKKNIKFAKFLSKKKKTISSSRDENFSCLVLTMGNSTKIEIFSLLLSVCLSRESEEKIPSIFV